MVDKHSIFDAPYQGIDFDVYARRASKLRAEMAKRSFQRALRSIGLKRR